MVPVPDGRLTCVLLFFARAPFTVPPRTSAVPLEPIHCRIVFSVDEMHSGDIEHTVFLDRHGPCKGVYSFADSVLYYSALHR